MQILRTPIFPRHHIDRFSVRRVLGKILFGLLGICLLMAGPGLASAQTIERLPYVVNQLPAPNDVRQLPGPGPRIAPALPGPQSTDAPSPSVPSVKAPPNVPTAILGSGRPVDSQIKIIRIPDLYGQCPPERNQQLDLCHALNFSASNNPVLRRAQADVASARAGKTVAFSPFLPSVSVEDELYKSSNPFTSIIYGSGDVTANQELNIAQINAEWLIWDFGQRLGTYRQSDIMLKIAQLRCARACQDVGYKTADAYFQVLIGRASVHVADDSIKRSEEYLRVAKNLYNAGKIDREGVLSAQLELVNSQQLMVNAIARRQVAVAGLNNVLGARLLEAACVQDVESQPDFFPLLDICVQTGLLKRPEMCVARNEIAYAIQQCKIAKAQFLPSAKASGSYSNIVGTFETDLWAGSVLFDWNLYSGGKRSGQIREAQALVAQAKAHEQQIRDNIIYEVNQSYEKLRAARHQLTLSRAAIVVAKEKQRIVLNKFQVGTASPTDVVDAQTQLTTAEQDYYTAIYKLHIAIADINYRMGNIACCPTGGM